MIHRFSTMIYKQLIIFFWLVFVLSVRNVSTTGCGGQLKDSEEENQNSPTTDVPYDPNQFVTINVLQYLRTSIIFQAMYNNKTPVAVDEKGRRLLIRCLQGPMFTQDFERTSRKSGNLSSIPYPVYALQDAPTNRTKENNYCEKEYFQRWSFPKRLIRHAENHTYKLEDLLEDSTYELYLTLYKLPDQPWDQLEVMQPVYMETPDLPTLKLGQFWITNVTTENPSMKREVTILWRRSSGRALIKQYEKNELLCKNKNVSLETGFFTALISKEDATFEMRRLFRNGTVGKSLSTLDIPEDDLIMSYPSFLSANYTQIDNKTALVQWTLPEWMTTKLFDVNIFLFRDRDEPATFAYVRAHHKGVLIEGRGPGIVGIGIGTLTSKGMVFLPDNGTTPSLNAMMDYHRSSNDTAHPQVTWVCISEPETTPKPPERPYKNERKALLVDGKENF